MPLSKCHTGRVTGSSWQARLLACLAGILAFCAAIGPASAQLVGEFGEPVEEIPGAFTEQTEERLLLPVAEDDYRLHLEASVRGTAILGFQEGTSLTGREVSAITADPDAPWKSGNHWGSLGYSTSRSGTLRLKYGNRTLETELSVGGRATPGEEDFENRGRIRIRSLVTRYQRRDVLFKRDYLRLMVGQFGLGYGHFTRYGHVAGRFGELGETMFYEMRIRDYPDAVLLKLAHGFHIRPPFGQSIPTFTSWVTHHHAEFKVEPYYSVHLHTAVAGVLDDNVPGTKPDGRIYHHAVDGDLWFANYGRLRYGFSYTKAENATHVSGIEVASVRNGEQLVETQLGVGSEGTGTIYTALGEYEFSAADWAYRRNFWVGEPTDLKFYLRGMHQWIRSQDPVVHGTRKYKLGVELEVQPVPWGKVELRADRVVPDTSDFEQSYWVFGPSLWYYRRDRGFRDARTQVGLQYIRSFYGERPLPRNPEDVPAEHIVWIQGRFRFR